MRVSHERVLEQSTFSITHVSFAPPPPPLSSCHAFRCAPLPVFLTGRCMGIRNTVSRMWWSLGRYTCGRRQGLNCPSRRTSILGPILCKPFVFGLRPLRRALWESSSARGSRAPWRTLPSDRCDVGE